MEFLIIVEMITAVLFVGLAVIVGYRGNKVTGAIIFGLVAAIVSALFLASSLFVESYFIDEVVVWIGSLAEAALILIGMATLLGYLGNEVMGAVLLSVGAALASTLCLAGAGLGYSLGKDTGAWIGLLVGVLMAGVLARRFLGGAIKGRSGRFLSGIWFGFCSLCVFSYLAGGWIGLLTITLPAVALFWGGLLRISAYILPLRDRSQRSIAFRSLITFSMGTNYPYYFVDENGKLETRVDGNPFLQFFAGPGLVYTGCAHAAYITDGVYVKDVFKPGLNFTGKFDRPPRIIDLRPQLRAFDVAALTKDGVPIKVLTFIPFKIAHSCNQQVELGKSFPFRCRAVFDIVAEEFVERKRIQEQGGERFEWDGELVRFIATPIVQDIISQYNIDELCAQHSPVSDPRGAIVAEMKTKVQEALPRGIELIGGGIANLMPQDDTVLERRLENWRTEWKRKILSFRGEAKAARVKEIERVRADAQIVFVLELAKVVQNSKHSGDVSRTALGLCLSNILSEFAGELDGPQPVPDSFEGTFKYLRDEIE